MLHYVTGKGGVGKSTIAAALAIAAAERGARVLAIELGPRGGLARALASRTDVRVAQIDGDWAYDEFSGDGGVKALDLDEPEVAGETAQ